VQQEFLERDITSPCVSDANSEGNMTSSDKKDIKGWITLVIAVIVALGGGFWALHVELGKIDTHLSNIDRRSDAFDNALRIRSKSQSGDTQELIKEILSQAKDLSRLGRLDSANKFLAVAARMTARDAQARKPASPEFFQQSVQHLDAMRSQPQLDQSSHLARLQLALYRSALNTIDRGAALNNYEAGVKPGTVVNGGSITGGQQILDGVNWSNFTFIDSHIIYRGGPVTLSNVNFVNCTFEVPQSLRGDQFLDLAILKQNYVVIG
jgi:hypothetical protein